MAVLNLFGMIRLLQCREKVVGSFGFVAGRAFGRTAQIVVDGSLRVCANRVLLCLRVFYRAECPPSDQFGRLLAGWRVALATHCITGAASMLFACSFKCRSPSATCANIAVANSSTNDVGASSGIARAGHY